MTIGPAASALKFRLVAISQISDTFNPAQVNNKRATQRDGQVGQVLSGVHPSIYERNELAIQRPYSQICIIQPIASIS